MEDITIKEKNNEFIIKRGKNHLCTIIKTRDNKFIALEGKGNRRLGVIERNNFEQCLTDYLIYRKESIDLLKSKIIFI